MCLHVADNLVGNHDSTIIIRLIGEYLFGALVLRVRAPNDLTGHAVLVWILDIAVEFALSTVFMALVIAFQGI